MERQMLVSRGILIIVIGALFFGSNATNISFTNNISEVILVDENLESKVQSTNLFHINKENPIQTIEYNVRTKMERLGPATNVVKNQLPQTTIPSYTGILRGEYLSTFTPVNESSLLHTSFPFPPDDRERVTPTTSYPWSSICKLFITAQDNTQYIGSGFIVDEFHILTCGHCIYIHESGGWVSEVEVIPGMDGSITPFGTAYATYYRTYTGWIESEMIEHDWALVTLDRNIGSYTGWMGRKTENPSSSIYTGTLNTAGYPYDLNYGNYMYFDSDDGEDADEYNHWYWMDSAQGQSGSPVWMYDGANRYVISINAYEYEYGVYANIGTRINNEKYDRLNTWLSEDSSSAPLDKPDLMDRGYDTSFNPNYVVAGDTVFNVSSEVLNAGTASASSFLVNFYASKDTLLTENDYLIGSVAIDGLAPYEYINADWSGVFPSSIPTGNYYIGWKIDANNNIDELDENNNIMFDYYIQINVKGTFNYLLLFSILIPVLVAIGVAIAILFLAWKTLFCPILSIRS